MKNWLDKLDKTLDHRMRLAIMSLLTVNTQLDFTTLRDELSLTDGSLASHMTTLEKAGYIEVLKSFRGRKPLTQYRITPEGKQAFTNHLDALEHLLHPGRD